mmetsp:Transcript_12804/g.38412  ORF Transcript_12804/g.38412 Transcript_12804/m.38412 type:complete len:429 (-) Transcript_12804:1897-3183(-)
MATPMAVGDKGGSSPPAAAAGGLRSISRGVWLVYLNVVLYALCYQLQRPIEPFLVKRLGASNVGYGSLQSFFSAVQTVGAPVVGVLLGRYGTRMAFVVMFLASALSYGILSQTDSMTMLYLSKIPSLLQHGFLVAQTAIADQTTEGPTRLTSLAYLTTAYTVGASIGPAVGGFLGASGNYFVGAKLAVAGSLLSATLAFFGPEGRPTEATKGGANKSGGIFDGLTEMADTAKIVLPLLTTKIVVSIGNAMYQGSMPIVLRDNFKFTEADMGLYMSVFMGSSGIFAMFVGPIAKRLPGKTILVYCLGCMSAAFCAKTVVGSTMVGDVEFGASAIAWILFTFLANLAGHLLALAITSESTATVPDDRRGTLMGLEHGGFSAARIVGPSMGIMLMGDGAFWYVDAAIMAINSSVFGYWLMAGTSSERAKAD